MLPKPEDLPPASNLSAAWQPVGPNQVASLSYGNVTGRVTAIAIDPADPSGNTVYLGTTGGGVWRSANAAGPAASVSFTPLTDTLPVFSANAGSSATPSLSIGAISVHSGVVLAGTGDTNDALDSYYGDGLLRSSDNGVTWTLVQESNDGVAGFHSFTGLGFAGFAWSGTTPNLVVAAVSQAAEAGLVNAVDQGNSVMGLYYSTDAGKTWQMATLMDGSQILQRADHLSSYLPGRAVTAVVWNPIRRSFYAAVQYHGYYESADGMNWTRMANQPGTGLTMSACPTAPTSSGSASCPMFRGALAVQPNTGDMFALTVDSNNADQGLWQDVCAASGGSCSSGTVTFGTRLASAPLEAGNGSSVIPQADYSLALSAVPSGASGSAQDTLLFVGTVDLYRCSLAAGCTLRNTTNAVNACSSPAKVAPNQHAVAGFTTSNQPLLYFGNDGGLWRSTDGVDEQASPCSADDANHFQNLNGGIGSLAEVVSFAQSPTDSGVLLAGLGASGTAATASASDGFAWPQLSAAEGGVVGIDQTNPLLWYASIGAGVAIHECSKGSACTASDFKGSAAIGTAQVAGDDSLVDVPWLLDPALTSNLLVGTCRVWRGPTDSGVLWSSSNAISGFLAGPKNGSCDSTNPVIRSLAAGGVASSANAAQNAGSSVLYAGMAGAFDGGGSAGGHLFSITSANTATNTTAWTDLSSSPVTNASGAFNVGQFDISSLAADPHDRTGATIYASVMGFAGSGVNAVHVYRSVDFGAHWTNISSNLPNAPANDVVVDPNDANTLYVAMDTGVYVTQDVTNCTVENCWSIYGTTLPNAPVIALAAAPDMPTGDGRTGELRAGTYGRGIWQIPLVTAAATQGSVMTLAPASLDFGAQAVSTASLTQTITVTNSGSTPLSISNIATTGDYTESDSCSGSSIAPGESCAVQVRFSPAAVGVRSGVLTVYGNVPGGQATASLSGTGSAAGPIVLNPVALRFASTTAGATSAAQNITISNISSSTIPLQTPVITGGDFALAANSCGASLGPSMGCTVAIAFTPSVSGIRKGVFTISGGAGTQTASLIGIGASPPTDALSSLTLTYLPQQIDTASAAQQIILTNAGDQPLTLIAAQITAGDFTVVNACGNSLNAHASCSIQVAFAPKNVGSLTGVLTISDQYRSQTIMLSGVGVAPPGVSLAPFSEVDYPTTGVGITSTGQTVTLTNNEGSPLEIQGVSLSGDFALVPGSSTCGVSVAIDAACTLQVVFAPSAGGPRSGTLTVTDSAANSPQVLALRGMGVDFSLTPNGPANVTIANGQNAVFPLLLRSAANVTGTVIFTCAGMPANSTCNITPNDVALGNTTTVSVTVLTGVSTTPSALRPQRGSARAIWIAVVLPLCFAGARRARLSRLAGVGVLCLLIAVSGCGAAREIPLENSSSPNPTPGAVTAAGTYTVVATASSAGLARSVNLTLIVQ